MVTRTPTPLTCDGVSCALSRFETVVLWTDAASILFVCLSAGELYLIHWTFAAPCSSASRATTSSPGEGLRSPNPISFSLDDTLNQNGFGMIGEVSIRTDMLSALKKND